MRTVRTKVYSFEELSNEAKQVDIENYRNSGVLDDVCYWAVDDCTLFEPKQEELDRIGFKDTDFIITNNRKDIYFNADRNWFLDCAKAMEVKHCDYFYKWLNITDEFLLQKVSFLIFTPNGRNSDTTIEFICDEDFDILTNDEEKVLENAKIKFDNHIRDVLKRIETAIDYRYSDEAIEEDILANEYEFLSNGQQF
jgi:hypothetical protein